MADRVRKFLEEMVPELEALESRQQGRVLGQLSEDTKRALRENLDELLDALLRN